MKLQRKRTFGFRGVMFILVMAFLLLGVTHYMWKASTRHTLDARLTKFESLADESERALRYRIASYEQALLGARGFFEGSDSVKRGEWHAYVQSLDILRNFPGINGIGWIEDVKSHELDNFLARVREDGAPDFEIKPHGDHLVNFITTYIEPIELNRPSLGLNIAFERNRFEAATNARDTGQATITRRILLVQDTEKMPGFLLLLPMYAKPLLSGDLPDFKGWLYAPFIGQNFMKGLTRSQGNTLHLQVYDGNVASPETLIYDSNADRDGSVRPLFEIRKHINVMQQGWTLVWSSTPAFERLESSNEPLMVLASGILFSSIFLVFMAVMLVRAAPSEKMYQAEYILPLVFLVAISLVTFVLYKQVNRAEMAFLTATTQQEAQAVKNTIISKVESRVLALRRMAGRWSLRNGTPEKEWRQDARFYVNDQPGLKTVEWVDADLHVRWVEPQEGNQKVVGMNVAFDTVRNEALQGAAEREVMLTPPLDLMQGYKGFIAYLPIHAGERSDGFIAGLFSVNDLMESVLAQSQKDNFSMALSSGGGRFYEDNGSGGRMEEQPWTIEEPINLYGRSWVLEVTPKPEFVRRHHSFLPMAILVVGHLLALLIAMLVFYVQRARQKSAQLAEKDNQLTMFVKHAPAAVAMFDTKIQYMAASDRWYQDYHLKGRDIIGKSHYEVFPEIPLYYPHWKEMHYRCLAGEVIKMEEELFLRDDGSEEWLRYEFHPWYKEEGALGGIIMFTEIITERKRIEQMKSEFISTVNHELRTPITSIQGSLGLLKANVAGELSENARKLVNLSYDNCERLTLLVNDILDVEKVAAGKMDYRIAKEEICALIREVIQQAKGYADKFKVTFHLVDTVQEAYVEIDRLRFTQALTNLLSNAVKFSPPYAMVTITVGMEDGHNINIAVADKGPGIPKEFRDKIFGRFAQADSSSTRSKGGTGLGLNITKSIIEAFRGSVRFDTIEGEGSVFYIILPTSETKES